MRVLIIGAGLAGLALAQRLVAAKVDVAVFERNASTSDGLAGYGIYIDRNGQRALQTCLPRATFDEFDRIAGHSGVRIHFSDERLGCLAVYDAATSTESEEPAVQRRSIPRLELREILQRGLDGPGGVIHWGKEFQSYEIPKDDGPIRAHFADGTYVVGDVLIGADASNSRVRTQYLPSFNRLDLGIANIVGRTPLTPELRSRLPSHLIDGSVNNVIPPGQGWMFLSAWRQSKDTATSHSGDYLVWAYASARAGFAADLERQPGNILCEVVLKRIAKWSPYLHTVVSASDMRTVAAVPLRTMPRLPDWQPTRVTLVGDAVHNMTPMAGIGANTALRDAAILSGQLLDAISGRRTLVDAVGQYERQMRGYANAAVELSRLNAERAASGGFVGRHMFRAVLRVAEAIPPFKRRMFASMSKKYDG
ncbi:MULTISPECIES: FAD-dependent oxidoreductase [Burkholderia cepacia complex]|uniref:FAD-dependent oxidoreductase n=1 Tax=Burkholderia cepacia complex TaxID=87882 RepID=UPI0022EA5A9C|nr:MULTISPECIES: FAD-dependent monooxygenase [Burkholderia cepacia complex]MDA3672146.1 FAD-dependent oxidoreductase [Burkholderia cenocepacia]MDA3681499.1 FAD-dependent oxidoreductase [Burkholderia cenocepacia]MDA3689112.1 FAD-dependent oxidoreductase [Burkholderia cenocepacia]MDA3696455.1 FAD-dependent oxidoreductase [Burkholderia cenocepacia]MDA3703894.1 FAD-dependent oxidoreductase [Burkholderia cenocepacia]